MSIGWNMTYRKQGVPVANNAREQCKVSLLSRTAWVPRLFPRLSTRGVTEIAQCLPEQTDADATDLGNPIWNPVRSLNECRSQSGPPHKFGYRAPHRSN